MPIDVNEFILSRRTQLRMPPVGRELKSLKDDLDALLSIIRHPECRIIFLDLSLCIDAIPMCILIEALRENTTIKSLNIQGCRLTGMLEVEGLVQNERITTLNISNNKISKQEVIALAKSKYITSLNLAGNNIGNSGAEALAKNKKITTLNVQDNDIDEDGAMALATSVSITDLDIGKNSIGNSGAEALAQNEKITTLNVQDNDIDEDGAQALAQNTFITRLNLSVNNVGNIGAIALARNQRIRHLNLQVNQIGDRGASALSENRIICELEIEHNEVTANLLQRLHESVRSNSIRQLAQQNEGGISQEDILNQDYICLEKHMLNNLAQLFKDIDSCEKNFSALFSQYSEARIALAKNFSKEVDYTSPIMQIENTQGQGLKSKESLGRLNSQAIVPNEHFQVEMQDIVPFVMTKKLHDTLNDEDENWQMLKKHLYSGIEDLVGNLGWRLRESLYEISNKCHLLRLRVLTENKEDEEAATQIHIFKKEREDEFYRVQKIQDYIPSYFKLLCVLWDRLSSAGKATDTTKIVQQGYISSYFKLFGVLWDRLSSAGKAMDTTKIVQQEILVGILCEQMDFFNTYLIELDKTYNFVDKLCTQIRYEQNDFACGISRSDEQLVEKLMLCFEEFRQGIIESKKIVIAIEGSFLAHIVDCASGELFIPITKKVEEELALAVQQGTKHKEQQYSKLKSLLAERKNALNIIYTLHADYIRKLSLSQKDFLTIASEINNSFAETQCQEESNIFDVEKRLHETQSKLEETLPGLYAEENEISEELEASEQGVAELQDAIEALNRDILILKYTITNFNSEKLNAQRGLDESPYVDTRSFEEQARNALAESQRATVSHNEWTDYNNLCCRDGSSLYRRSVELKRQCQIPVAASISFGMELETVQKRMAFMHGEINLAKQKMSYFVDQEIAWLAEHERCDNIVYQANERRLSFKEDIKNIDYAIVNCRTGITEIEEQIPLLEEQKREMELQVAGLRKKLKLKRDSLSTVEARFHKELEELENKLENLKKTWRRTMLTNAIVNYILETEKTLHKQKEFFENDNPTELATELLQEGLQNITISFQNILGLIAEVGFDIPINPKIIDKYGPLILHYLHAVDPVFLETPKEADVFSIGMLVEVQGLSAANEYLNERVGEVVSILPNGRIGVNFEDYGEKSIAQKNIKNVASNSLSVRTSASEITEDESDPQPLDNYILPTELEELKVALQNKEELLLEAMNTYRSMRDKQANIREEIRLYNLSHLEQEAEPEAIAFKKQELDAINIEMAKLQQLINYIQAELLDSAASLLTETDVVEQSIQHTDMVHENFYAGLEDRLNIIIDATLAIDRGELKEDSQISTSSENTTLQLEFAKTEREQLLSSIPELFSLEQISQMIDEFEDRKQQVDILEKQAQEELAKHSLEDESQERSICEKIIPNKAQAEHCLLVLEALDTHLYMREETESLKEEIYQEMVQQDELTKDFEELIKEKTKQFECLDLQLEEIEQQTIGVVPGVSGLSSNLEQNQAQQKEVIRQQEEIKTQRLENKTKLFCITKIKQEILTANCAHAVHNVKQTPIISNAAASSLESKVKPKIAEKSAPESTDAKREKLLDIQGKLYEYLKDSASKYFPPKSVSLKGVDSEELKRPKFVKTANLQVNTTFPQNKSRQGAIGLDPHAYAALAAARRSQLKVGRADYARSILEQAMMQEARRKKTPGPHAAEIKARILPGMSSVKKGEVAESILKEYLKKMGYNTDMATKINGVHGFDIVAVKNEANGVTPKKIYIIEVKYRKTGNPKFPVDTGDDVQMGDKWIEKKRRDMSISNNPKLRETERFIEKNESKVKLLGVKIDGAGRLDWKKLTRKIANKSNSQNKSAVPRLVAEHPHIVKESTTAQHKKDFAPESGHGHLGGKTAGNRAYKFNWGSSAKSVMQKNVLASSSVGQAQPHKQALSKASMNVKQSGSKAPVISKSGLRVIKSFSEAPFKTGGMPKTVTSNSTINKVNNAPKSSYAQQIISAAKERARTKTLVVQQDPSCQQKTEQARQQQKQQAVRVAQIRERQRVVRARVSAIQATAQQRATVRLAPQSRPVMRPPARVTQSTASSSSRRAPVPVPVPKRAPLPPLRR